MRLFLAIDPGDDFRRRFGASIESIRASRSGVRWVRDEKLHVTLSFFGEIGEDHIPRISEVARQVSQRYEPFTVSVQGAGVFPDWRRLRVVWFGLRDAGELSALANDLRAVRPEIGLEPDRPFRAHLTIGRATGPVSAEQKTSLSQALAPFKGAYPFDVSRVILMGSTLSPAGSAYTEVDSFPLRGA